jgi:hypothetical protein
VGGTITLPRVAPQHMADLDGAHQQGAKKNGSVMWPA